MNGKISAGDRRIQAALIGLVGAAAVILLWGLGWTESWEARTWDWRARLLAEPGPATDEIRLILVDQNSLDWGSREYAWSWPWPREIYGVIIDHCRRMGAKALAVDVLFTEPSSYGESDDRKLGEAISRFGRLAGALFLGEKSGSEEKWPDYIPEPGLILDDPERRLAPGSPISRCAFPIPEVSRNAALLSNVQLQPDADGVYRRGKLFERFDGKNIPYLGLGAYLASHPERELRAGPGSVSLGPHTVPTDSEGHVLFRFRGVSGTHRAYSAAAVIQSEIRMMSDEPPVITDPDAFKDKYVFLGFSAPGLYDLRSSPVSGVFPGVEIHATLLDNFLSGDFIRPLSGWLVIFGICVMAGCCAFGAGMLVRPSAIAGMGLVLLSLPPVLAVAGYSVGFAFPLVPLEAAGALTLLLAVGVKYATEGRQKRFIKQAFRQYISPPLIEQLIENPAALRLGGERRSLSIFFSDLESFTTISESLPPEGLSALLNEYLTAMTDIIIEEGGTVDKYEGDAIIAFWNAPLSIEDHPERCVTAALRCQARLARMRPAFQERIGRQLNMRIGMNTGEAVVGNFGSQTKFDYTIIGDAVNLAARLEGANKAFGTYTMISEFTRKALENQFAFRELARLAVMGRKEPVTVFEPMYRKEYEMKKEIFRDFDAGRDLFYTGDFRAAAERFALIERFDRAAEEYKKQSERLALNPPDNWKGVWMMTRK